MSVPSVLSIGHSTPLLRAVRRKPRDLRTEELGRWTGAAAAPAFRVCM